MAFCPDLESHTKYQQNNSTVDSLALEFAALLPRLEQYALRLTHNSAVADDLVQETIARGIENIHLWVQGTDLRAWLFTILHNQHVSDVRRALRYRTLVRSTYAARSAACPPRQVERLQLRDLERALARLPEAQRSVVLLIGLEAQHYETVATCLGIPVGTVRSRLFRGRLRLRQLTDGAPLPQQVQSRPKNSIKLSSGLIRRIQRSRAGRAGRVGDRDRSTPRSTASRTRQSSPAPQ